MKRGKAERGLRVAVVGAGAGGLAAAWHLEARGHRVTVFERQPRVGGLCETVPLGGHPYDLGAALLSWDYAHTFQFIRRYGLAVEPVAAFRTLDRATGEVLPLNWLINKHDKARLALAAVRYVAALSEYHGEVGGAGFRDLVANAPELCQPFDRWLESRGCAELCEVFLPPVTCYGYGKLSELPAAYGLKYLNLGNLSTVLYMSGVEALDARPRWPKRLRDGMQALFEYMAGDLADVRTGCRIEAIERDAEGGVVVRSRGSRRQRVDEFDRLVVACKQDPETLAELPMELTPREKALFARVVTENYFTVVCDATGIGDGIYCPIVEHGDLSLPPSGDPIFLGRLWPGSPILNVYAAADADVTEVEVRERLAPAFARMKIAIGDVHTVRRWRYFPHASAAALGDGFHEELESLQGETRTYWAGALTTFECVEEVLTQGADLAERHFAPVEAARRARAVLT